MTTQTGSGSGDGLGSLDICNCHPNFTGPNCESMQVTCNSSKLLLFVIFRTVLRLIVLLDLNYQLIVPVSQITSVLIENPCMNGGTCELGTIITEFSCICTSEFNGTTCDGEMNTLKNQNHYLTTL